MNVICPEPTERTVHLMHCVEPVPCLIGGGRREDVHKSQQNEADKVFSQAKMMLEPKGFTCHTHLREGTPSDEILSLAKETGCEAIIMGTRGHNRLECLFVGVVSSDVLKDARVPVILANKPNRPA